MRENLWPAQDLGGDDEKVGLSGATLQGTNKGIRSPEGQQERGIL